MIARLLPVLTLSWDGALVFSVISFHGRGFFLGGLRLDDPVTVLAALEPVTGKPANPAHVLQLCLDRTARGEGWRACSGRPQNALCNTVA